MSKEQLLIDRFLKEAKERLIKSLTEKGVLRSPSVTKAFRSVPREMFILPRDVRSAYEDVPLPIPGHQTISQPLTVAFMTELLEPKAGQKVLEVGSGSGYQAAILSKIVGAKGKIVTTEIVPELFDFARENLRKARIKNVDVIFSDGSEGYEKQAPYDRIIVTAGAPRVPDALKRQLKVGGRMVIPIGEDVQTMTLLIKKARDKFETSYHGEFRFVPLKGKWGWEFR